LSLNFCPYRAMSVVRRPLRFRSYPGGNFSDTGGRKRLSAARGNCRGKCSLEVTAYSKPRGGVIFVLSIGVRF
jgi:hypothetical protein